MLSPVFHRGILRSTKPEYRSDPVELLGSSRKNTLSAEIYFVSSASKGMYPPPEGDRKVKRKFSLKKTTFAEEKPDVSPLILTA
jgi:hypothetical protein